jgi:hypothetical protein
MKKGKKLSEKRRRNLMKQSLDKMDLEKYRSQVYKCLKKTRAPKEYVELIKDVESVSLLVSYINDVLPGYKGFLRKANIPPFYLEKPKDNYGKEILTPMGNKR